MKKLCMYAVFDVSTGVCLVHGQKRKDLSKLFDFGKFWRGFRRVSQYGELKAVPGHLLLILYWKGGAQKRLGKYSEPTDAGIYIRFRGTYKPDQKKMVKRMFDLLR